MEEIEGNTGNNYLDLLFGYNQTLRARNAFLSEGQYMDWTLLYAWEPKAEQSRATLYVIIDLFSLGHICCLHVLRIYYVESTGCKIKINP